MNYIFKSVAAVLLTFAAQWVQAAPFGSEARSLAMGNASVALADIAAAPFSNPAMLAQQTSDSDFELLLPAFGIYLDDSDGMIDLIDRYQAAQTANDANAQLAAVQALDGKVMSPQGTLATSIGVSGDKYSFAVSARNDIVFAGGVDNIAQNVSEVNDSDKNVLTLAGVSTREIGVSLATSMDLMGRKLSFGLMPKIVNVELLTFSESLSTVDTGVTDLLSENNTVDMGSFTTLDGGLALQLSDSIMIGLAAKNLLSEELKEGPATIKFDTQARAGAAYLGSFFRLGADIDLTENDSVQSLLSQAKSRMLSVGAEFNAFDFAQLRLGVQKNIASGISDGAKKQLLTAGIGIWLGFHLDVTAVAADNVYGLFAQSGFRF